jgi:hypothetical protein
VFETYQWTQSNNRVRREREKLEQSMLDAAAHRSLTTTSQKSPASGRGGDISPPPPPNPMNETMRALEERGQKIQEVSEKSEALREVRKFLISYFHCVIFADFIVQNAVEFHNLARQLRIQTQQNMLASQQAGSSKKSVDKTKK